jgi:hypothetical protein
VFYWRNEKERKGKVRFNKNRGERKTEEAIQKLNKARKIKGGYEEKEGEKKYLKKGEKCKSEYLCAARHFWQSLVPVGHLVYIDTENCTYCSRIA